MTHMRIVLWMVISLVALLAHLPLSWVAPKYAPLTYVGTVWKGGITNIPNFAPVRTRVSLMNVFKGIPPIGFTTRMPGLDVAGTATLGGKVNLKTTGTMAFVTRVDGRLAGLHGRYDVSVFDMLIREKCQSGTGTVSTDILSRNEVNWQWAGPELAGPISCEDGDVVMKLSGKDGLQTVDVDIRLSLSGTYKITANVETLDARAGVFLPLYGFQKSDKGYRLNEQGNWL